MRLRIALWLCAALFPAHAWAGDADFRLNRSFNGEGILFNCPAGGGGCSRNDPLFKDFATQLGFVLAPRMASPAETLGHAGFHVGILWSGSFVDDSQAFWRLTDGGERTGNATSFLQTLQLDVRKGLPFSFELGVNFMWLADSELFAPGLELRWALQEGYRFVPDLSLRGAVNHLVGSRDMLLTTIALDAMLSKNFGLFGMINLTPYAGWSLVMVEATSRVIDPTPLLDTDLQNNLVFQSLGATSKVNHKLTVGLRTLVYVVNFSLQGEIQMLPAYEGDVKAITTLTAKLGLDF